MCDVCTADGPWGTIEYDTNPVLVDYDTLYTARIEADPYTAGLRFYLDGTQVDSYTPDDAAALISAANLRPQVGVWNGDPHTVATRYVDDVCITGATAP